MGNSRLVFYTEFVAEARGFLVRGNTQDFIQRTLYWFGVWEPNLTDFVQRTMAEAPNRVFVDVGANIGYFSLLVAKHQPNVNVVAIEGFPPTFEKLRANVRLNQLNNVRLIASAVGDEEVEVEFFQAPGYNEGATTTIKGLWAVEAVTVRCGQLAKLLTESELSSARLIKIDVEGAEAKVVKGLIPVFGKMPQDVEIVVELFGDSAEHSQCIFDFFRAEGFNAYRIENEYNVRAYLCPSPPQRPTRLAAIPAGLTDVVFSRADVDVL